MTYTCRLSPETTFDPPSILTSSHEVPFGLRHWAFAPLFVSFVWILLSFQQLFKIFHAPAGIAICIAFVAVCFSSFHILSRRSLQWPRKWVPIFVGAGWSFIALAYPILHGLSERHVFGPGSDRENALYVACHAWLSGHFPYGELTVLHHPITPMPGALLFAMPFYWLGGIGIQNLVWLAVFSYWCYRFFDRGWLAVWFLFLLVYFNPCVMQDVMTGGDFFTNFAYVIVIFTAVVSTGTRRNQQWSRWLWPLLMGIALSSRPIYSLLYPCLFAAAWRRSGLATALQTLVLALLGMMAVTVPIFLWDPPHFTPFNVGSNAYALVPAGLHPALLTFAIGLGIASVSLKRTPNLSRGLGIAGCALTAVTLPYFIADRVLQPELFPLINLIYLSPGLLLISLWLLKSSFWSARAATVQTSATIR